MSITWFVNRPLVDSHDRTIEHAKVLFRDFKFRATNVHLVTTEYGEQYVDQHTGQIYEQFFRKENAFQFGTLTGITHQIDKFLEEVGNLLTLSERPVLQVESGEDGKWFYYAISKPQLTQVGYQVLSGRRHRSVTVVNGVYGTSAGEFGVPSNRLAFYPCYINA